MKHRIRAAGIIIQDEKILLVAHRSPKSGLTHWIPPGGGIERVDDSIFACAAREIFEETGLVATLSQIAYIQEFYDGQSDVRSCEFYLIVDRFSGTPTLDHLLPPSPNSDWITEIRWFKRNELRSITVYPEELRDRVWQDFAAGFPTVRYLGLQARG